MSETLEGLIRLGKTDDYVEQDVLRIVQKVQEYDPNLKIQYLPPDEVLNPSQAPYVLVERGKDNIWRVVFYIWELDDRVLHRIYAMDTFKRDVLGELDANNKRAKEGIKKDFEEKKSEAQDLTKSIIASPKDTYSAPVDGKIVKFSSLPRDDRG